MSSIQAVRCRGTALAALAALAVVSLLSCSVGADRTGADGSTSLSVSTGTASPSTSAGATAPVDPWAVPGRLEPVGGPGQAAAGATETVHLVSHGDRLFAATGFWTSPSPQGGSVLVKDRSDGPWQVALQTESLRVTALESFVVPASSNRGTAVPVLLTHGRIGGVSQLRWLVGDDAAFDGSFPVGGATTDVRSFGGRAEGDEYAFYAGTRPGGMLRGVWDAGARTIRWSSQTELTTTEPDGSPPRFAGMADCGGAMYATANVQLWRRNDGDLPSGTPRWSLMYQAPPVGDANTGLRGLTCVDHRGQPSLLVAREGSGQILRFDGLPSGTVTGLLPTPAVDAEARQVIGDGLRAWGHDVPTTGTGSVNYVIPAYNEMLEVPQPAPGGPKTWLVGVEFTYLGGACPAGRTCLGPYEASACLMIRTESGDDDPIWGLRCLGGPEMSPAGTSSRPVTRGAAFVATRTIRPSPWENGRLYLGGYDANSIPSTGTAWVATTSLADLLAAHPGRPSGGFHPVTPSRIADSRTGLGLAAPLGAGLEDRLAIGGHDPVPQDATAVAVNITVTGGSAASHLTAWPANWARPTASTINWAAGETRANSAWLRLSPDGHLALRNNSGTVHVIVDVVGWFDDGAGGDALASGQPTRIVDSRIGQGLVGPLGAGTTALVPVAGPGSPTPPEATAVVLNLTAVGGTTDSHLSSWPGGGTQTATSSVNWSAGRTTPNLVTVPVGTDGVIALRNSAGRVDVVVDVVAWFVPAPPNHPLHPVSPERVADSRAGVGFSGRLTAGQTRTLPMTGRRLRDGSTVPADARAVVLNVTVTGGTVASHLTVWPDGQPPVLASNLNWLAGATVANQVVVPPGPGGGVQVFNNAGQVDVVVDLVGYIT